MYCHCYTEEELHADNLPHIIESSVCESLERVAVAMVEERLHGNQYNLVNLWCPYERYGYCMFLNAESGCGWYSQEVLDNATDHQLLLGAAMLLEIRLLNEDIKKACMTRAADTYFKSNLYDEEDNDEDRSRKKQQAAVVRTIVKKRDLDYYSACCGMMKWKSRRFKKIEKCCQELLTMYRRMFIGPFGVLQYRWQRSSLAIIPSMKITRGKGLFP